MRFKTGVVRLLGCLCICLLFMGVTVHARETDETDNSAYGTRIEVQLVNWNRRIYELKCQAYGPDSKNGAIRVYAGKNFHITDSRGDILSEGTYIDGSGDVSEDFKGGQVCRDVNGWYILWEKAKLNSWDSHSIYVQADSDFTGGNNQIIGVEGMSGIYLDSNSWAADFVIPTLTVNVAAEADASDVVFPVMEGIDLKDSDFLKKAVVKLDSVYGSLRDLPLKVQWYRVTDGVETPVGDMITSAPYYLPESEAERLTEPGEYRAKIYYNGEASTEEARQASGGYEVFVSEDTPMDEASLIIKPITGCIDAELYLEQLPYNNSVSHTFRFKLYRFDTPNEMITDDTPFTEYSVTFEADGKETVKSLQIGGLTAGWYTLVPENPEGDFVELIENRKDNMASNPRKGSSAGVDFYIGEIVDTRYSWEVICYQGQDGEDALGDNFFKITYYYKENLYGVTYEANLPEGSGLEGNLPEDLLKYRPGEMVSVHGGDGMTAEGWQFVGWAEDEGDGVYKAGEKIYSDASFHGIPVETQVAMDDDGVTLYGRWVQVYTVTYDGNTNTGGEVPKDTGGTVREGSDIYYSGDEVIVGEPGNLEKVDEDGTRYVFDGWSVNQDGSGIRLQAGDRLTVEASDVTLYAQWLAIDTNKYAVSYIASIPEGTRLAGELPKDREKYEVGAIVKVAGQGTMAIEHYRFAGWSLSSVEDALYQSGEELFGTKDVGKTVTGTETSMTEQGLTFYSRWIPLYQVIYHANVDDVEAFLEDTNEYEAEEMVTVLSGEKMYREGYQFLGWNTEIDGSGQNYDPGLKFNMPEENIELYAQWQKLPEPDTEPDEIDDLGEPKNGGIWPLYIFAAIGAACIVAYVVYQWFSHHKH